MIQLDIGYNQIMLGDGFDVLVIIDKLLRL